MRQIYLRPDEGKLNSARVIYRAKEGRAVGQLGKTCKALHLTPASYICTCDLCAIQSLH